MAARKSAGVLDFQHEYIELAQRSFNWIKSSDKDPFNKWASKETFHGRPVIKNDVHTEADGKNVDLYLTVLTSGTITWTVARGRSLFEVGNEPTLQQALLKCYVSYYKLLTKVKVQEAEKPKPGKVAGLYGNWLDLKTYENTSSKIKSIVTVIPIKEDRDRMIFVMNWPSLEKEKAYCTIDAVRSGRWNNPSPSEYYLTFGMTELSDSMDWYIYNPTQYMVGEAQCCDCKSLYPEPTCMGMLVVRGTGLVCGPCRDEHFGCNDDMWT